MQDRKHSDNNNVVIKINESGKYSDVYVDGIRMKSVQKLTIDEEVGAYTIATIQVIIKTIEA
jgi:hypothetical protein